MESMHVNTMIRSGKYTFAHTTRREGNDEGGNDGQIKCDITCEWCDRDESVMSVQFGLGMRVAGE